MAGGDVHNVCVCGEGGGGGTRLVKTCAARQVAVLYTCLAVSKDQK